MADALAATRLPGRMFFDDNGNLHLNGCQVINDAGDDISGSLEVLNATAPAEISLLDGAGPTNETVSKVAVLGPQGNLLVNPFLLQLVDTTAVAAGTNTATAYVMTKPFANVTGADGTKGVRFTAQQANDTPYALYQYVRNADATSTLKVYPESGGTIDGGAADAAYVLAAGRAALFVRIDEDTWRSFEQGQPIDLDAGRSGAAGSVDVFPGTAAKGKLAITCTDQTGDTTVSLVAGAMAAARTITLRDPGAAASILTSTDGTAAATTSTAVELTRSSDVSTRSVAAGGTLAVTEAAHEGRTILLDTATGSVCTLPAPVIGARFRFLVSVKATSNFHQVKVAAGTDFLAGSVNILDNDGTTQAAFAADGTADDNIQLNGTTQGGLVGDWIEVEGISATQWAIRGQLVCPAGSNPADMFSAAV